MEEAKSLLNDGLKKEGKVVSEKNRYYFEFEDDNKQKQRVAFSPLVGEARLKSLEGKKALGIYARGCTDLKKCLATVSVTGVNCYIHVCYVVPVFRRYLEFAPENMMLVYDMEPKVRVAAQIDFFDIMSKNKLISSKAAAEMKASINALNKV